ncbi:hypothetical protein AJ80_04348 [Polytolypa hystricis UAMH7299]|uniref:Carboxymuconolactone decarboxylase-like domain-containing protein n=1 Tax=Polytolypa hystricis (strain UAMH7299) TaxID=1447883 RepID=A0A2B7YBQ0_POLH7|nr:hypothetical protein AJ80_04348 [Polytolypa hystricis UAMH7299]
MSRVTIGTAAASEPALSLQALCEQVKELLPEDLRGDAWYIVTAAALVASGNPTELGHLYEYILDTEYPNLTLDQERRLSSRFSDLLMKEWLLVGIPTVLMGVSALAKVERLVNAENTKLDGRRSNIDFNTAIPSRGTKFLKALYKENLDPIFASWGSYGPDFAWMEKSVIYGLFLSDHSVLSAMETQLVTLSSIMCQGWPGPTLWHLRGTRRLGRSVEDVERIQLAIERVAVWCGKSVDGWPRVKDVKDEI